jgi:tetratricopeptide (TPR) repeat protein
MSTKEVRELGHTKLAQGHHAEGHQLLAQAFFGEKQYASAAREYRESIRHAPDNGDTHIYLGQALNNLGQHGEAIREIREGIRLHPGHSVGRLILAGILAEQGDHSGAVRELQDALRANPGFDLARSELIKQLYEVKDFAGVIRECREAIQRNPVGPLASELQGQLGQALYESGNYEEAAREFRKAIRLRSDYHVPHICLANTLWTLADWKGASNEYREAIRLVPADDPLLPALHHTLGLVLEKLSDRRAAFEQFSLAEQLAPGNADYSAARKRLSHP